MSDPIATLYDVLIVGGGPAGATAALYTSRAALTTLVIDKSITAGALGSASQIENYPGVTTPISGESLISAMRGQAEHFGAQFIKARIAGVDFSQETKTIFTAEGQTYTGRSVILATGARGRGVLLPGEEKMVGRGVSYCATCDGAFFKGKPVAVYGNDDFAADEAAFLARFASTVYFITTLKKWESDFPSNVTVLTGTTVSEIHGDPIVSEILINRAGTAQSLAVNGVFIYTSGNKPVVDYLYESLQLSDSACIMVDRDQKTTIPGVFACGDVICHDVQQVVVAAAQGCIAALSADKYLRNKDRVSRDYQHHSPK